jgi:hypothetical protein
VVLARGFGPGRCRFLDSITLVQVRMISRESTERIAVDEMRRENIDPASE